MSAQGLEIALARLYTDPDLRSRFLAEPVSALEGFDLDDSERIALCSIDRAGLVMAARSFLYKRKKSQKTNS